MVCSGGNILLSANYLLAVIVAILTSEFLGVN